MKFLLILLLCTLQLYEAKTDVKELHKILHFPGQELVGNYQALNDGNITYLVCQANHTIDEKNCKVIRENLFLSNSSLTCDIVVKLTDIKEHDQMTNTMEMAPIVNLTDVEEHDHMKNTMEIVPIEGNNAVLYRIEGETDAVITIFTINFDTCKRTEIDTVVKNLDSPIRDLIIVPYGEFYEVFYPTADDKYEKISISNEGEKISGPDNAINTFLRTSNYPLIHPISSNDSEKGFISLTYDAKNSEQKNDLDLTIFKPDGSMSTLGQYDVSKSSMISTTHDLIGMCFLEDEPGLLYRCVQYDQDGKLMFQSDPIQNDQTEILYSRNLQEGGFILLAGKSEKSIRDSAFKDMRFFAIKLDSIGKIVGSVDLQELQFPYRIEVAISISEKENDEYCASMARFYSREYDRNSTFLEVKSQCFKDSDFTREP